MPTRAASNGYVIGRPFLPQATLNLPGGKRFSVIADGLDDAHPSIGRAVLNGNPLDCATRSWRAANCASRCRPSRTRRGRPSGRKDRIRCRRVRAASVSLKLRQT
jgi:hypothetical protein